MSTWEDAKVVEAEASLTNAKAALTRAETESKLGPEALQQKLASEQQKLVSEIESRKLDDAKNRFEKMASGVVACLGSYLVVHITWAIAFVSITYIIAVMRK